MSLQDSKYYSFIRGTKTNFRYVGFSKLNRNSNLYEICLDRDPPLRGAALGSFCSFLESVIFMKHAISRWEYLHEDSLTGYFMACLHKHDPSFIKRTSIQSCVFKLREFHGSVIHEILLSVHLFLRGDRCLFKKFYDDFVVRKNPHESHFEWAIESFMDEDDYKSYVYPEDW